MIINQLKAPIQNFKSIQDFYDYCTNILNEKYFGSDNIEKFSLSDDNQASLQKKSILNDWIKYLTQENKAYSPAIQLVILSSITKTLNQKTNHLPPSLNKRKLADTIQEIEQKSKNNKDFKCNFDKLYRINLSKAIFDEHSANLDENLNG